MLSQMPKIELIRISTTPALTPAHPPGTPLYRDLDGVVKAAGQRHTLFLNSQVAPGQRAGLLLESLQ